MFCRHFFDRFFDIFPQFLVFLGNKALSGNVLSKKCSQDALGTAPAELAQNFLEIGASFWDPAGVQKSTKIGTRCTFCPKGGLGKRLLNNILLIFAPLPFGVALRTDFWRHFSLKCSQITIVSAILRKTRFSEKH